VEFKFFGASMYSYTALWWGWCLWFMNKSPSIFVNPEWRYHKFLTPPTHRNQALCWSAGHYSTYSDHSIISGEIPHPRPRTGKSDQTSRLGTTVSHSRGLWFKSWPRDQLSWLRFFNGFPQLLQVCSDIVR
jgi:hypothetical protein